MKITQYIRGNMSRAEFSRRYGIPVRTLEDWDAGKSTAPDYVINLLARAVYEDRIGSEVWFVVFNCTEGSKGTPCHDEAIIISTKNILDALKNCGKGTDKNFYDELRICTQNPLDEDAGDYDIIDLQWQEIE